MRKIRNYRRISIESLRRLGQIQNYAESAAFAIGELDAPPVRLGNLTSERQPEAGLPVVSMRACRWFPSGVPAVKA